MGSTRDAEYAFYAAEVGDLGSMADVKAAFFNKYPSGINPVGKSGNRVAFFGDSITQGSSDQINNYYQDSYPQYVMLKSGGAFRLVRNAGMSGDTATRGLARFDAEVAPYSPNIVVMMFGANDVGSRTFAQYTSDMTALVRKVKQIGALPVLCTVTPSGTTANHPLISKFNFWLRTYASREKLPLVDLHSAVLNTDGSGTYLPAYTSDGLHPTVAGMQVMATEMANALKNISPYSSKYYRSLENVDSVNILNGTNSLNLLDTNADGIPDGWGAYGGTANYAHSLITRPGFVGKFMQITQSANADMRVLTKGLDIQPVAGDVLEFTAVVNSDGGVAPSFKLTAQRAAGNITMLYTFSASVTDGYIYGEFIVPTGTTNVYVDIIAPAGTGVVSIQPCVTNTSTIKT